MHTEQTRLDAGGHWLGTPSMQDAALVLVFAGRPYLTRFDPMPAIARAYPGAVLAGCSTAGQIAGTTVDDDCAVVTAVRFSRARVHFATAIAAESDRLEAAGQALGAALVPFEPKLVLTLSEGLCVNGSALGAVLSRVFGEHVVVSGGLAGDGDAFERTLVWDGAKWASGVVAAVAFSGSTLRASARSLGGWDAFGPEREVTKAHENTLYSLDGESALSLYRRYLGPHAERLPHAALHFPLSVRCPDGRTLVRTVLSMDEKAGSLTFAGDIPEGSFARLMHANVDRLVDGAQGAAQAARDALEGAATLVLLVSCVGRRLVLHQRVDEELEVVREVFGDNARLAGFYAYGEFAPGHVATCELHNQTMTVTALAETAMADA